MEETASRDYFDLTYIADSYRFDWNPFLIHARRDLNREQMYELRKIAIEYGKDLVIYVPNHIVRTRRGYHVDDLPDYSSELMFSLPFETVKLADGAVAIGKTSIKMIKSRKERIFDSDLKYKVRSAFNFNLEDV